jgi:hypothetical protein
MSILYLDDYSDEDIIYLKKSEIPDDIENTDDIEYKDESKYIKPIINMKSDYNSIGERVVVFSVNIPLKNDLFKIDIVINNDLYKNIGKHFNK